MDELLTLGSFGRVIASVSASAGAASEDGKCDRSTFVNVQGRPASNISVSVGPGVSHSETSIQYVMTVGEPTAAAFYGNPYVFADLEQNELSMNTRFSMTFSPNLTLELFLQPLISAGSFSRYKEYAAPRSLRRLVYGTDVGTISVQPDTTGQGLPADITIDPDGAVGADTAFTFSDPSFTFRSLRGNAVLRWEYRPGSTLFLVRTRQGDSGLSRGSIDFGDDFSSLFRGPSQNIFLIKVNYWLGL